MATDTTDLGDLGNKVSSYIFGGNTGLTYDALRRRQAIAIALAEQGAKQAAPTTVGAGITQLGRALGSRMQENRLVEAENEYERNDSAAQRFYGQRPPQQSTPNQAVTPPAQPPPVMQQPPTPATPGQPNFMGKPYQAASVVPTPDVNPNAPPPLDQSPPTTGDEIRARITQRLQQQQNQKAVDGQPPQEVAQPNPTLPGALPPVQAQLLLASQQDQGATPSTRPTSPTGGAVDPLLLTRRNAVGGIESGGQRDPYSTVVSTGRGDNVYGRYGIKGSNIPQWTQEALGRAMSPQEFLADKQAQDTTFDHRMAIYANKYGEEGAGRAWYAGDKGMNNLRATDRFGRPNVQQYGQDYVRRLRGADAGDATGAPVQLASANIGATMSDAPPPGAARMMPNVTPDQDENPPTPTDIAPAPAMVAQAGNRISSDMFSPNRSTGAPPAPVGSPASQTIPPTGAVPSASQQVYVRPVPVEPEKPQEEQVSPREIDARLYLARNPTDPRRKVLAEGVIGEEEQRRKFINDRNITAYNAKYADYERQKAEAATSRATEQERQTQLNTNLAAEAQRRAFGNVPTNVDTKLTKSKEDTEGSITGLEAILNARAAMDAGALFGVGSQAQLNAYRLAAKLPGAAGDNARRIVAATERFPINLGGLIGQQTRLFGGSQLSPAEREFGEKMAGGNIALNEETARYGLQIAEKAARAKIAEHEKLLTSQLQGQPDNVREIYKARDVTPPIQMAPAKGSVAEKVQNMSPTDREALDWARVNSADPRAAAIKKRLGVP